MKDLIRKIRGRKVRKPLSEGADIPPLSDNIDGAASVPVDAPGVAKGTRKRSLLDRILRKPQTTGVDLVKVSERKSGGFKGFSGLFGGKDKSSEDDAVTGADGLEEITSRGDIDLIYDGDLVLQVGKKKVLLGLMWEPDRTDMNVKKQADSLGTSDLRYDLYINFRDANQLGFASSSRGLKPGLKAGVTAISQRRMGKSWLGAFRLGPDSKYWWVVGMRNGQVYEDQVLSDPEEARMVFMDNLEAPGWQRIAAPEFWGIGGTEDISLKDIIYPSKGISLKPVRPLKTYAPRIIIGGVLLVAATGGTLFYMQLQEQERLRQEELDRRLRAEIRVAPADYPWFDTPDPKSFIESCIGEMENLVRIIPGWTQGLVSCTHNQGAGTASVATGWNRSSGLVPWMLGAFSPDETQPSVDVLGLSASLNTSISFDTPEKDLDIPFDEERINLVLNRRIQSLSIPNVTITPIVQRVTPVQQREMRRPVFNRHEIRIQTSGGLHEYARLFSDMPALVPQTLVYDMATRNWNMTMSVYHPPILPNPPTQ